MEFEDVTEDDEEDIEKQRGTSGSNASKIRNDAQRRAHIRQLFSGDETARAIAIQELKAAWGHDEPSFDVEELSNHPQSAAIMAAKRDGWKEVVNWLIKL